MCVISASLSSGAFLCCGNIFTTLFVYLNNVITFDLSKQKEMTQQEFKQQFTTHSAGKGFAAFIPTKSGKIKLSIICGEFYYSTPRKDLDTIEAYRAYEMACFKGDGSGWADWSEIKEAGIFDIIGYGEHAETLEEAKDKSNCSVWGWVDEDRIIEIINNC